MSLCILCKSHHRFHEDTGRLLAMMRNRSDGVPTYLPDLLREIKFSSPGDRDW